MFIRKHLITLSAVSMLACSPALLAQNPTPEDAARDKSRPTSESSGRIEQDKPGSAGTPAANARSGPGDAGVPGSPGSPANDAAPPIYGNPGTANADGGKRGEASGKTKQAGVNDGAPRTRAHKKPDGSSATSPP